MRIQPAGFYGFDPNRVSMRLRAPLATPTPAPRRPSAASDLARGLLDLRRQLDSLRSASGPRRTSAASKNTASQPARAVSAEKLEVTIPASPTTLQTSGLIGSPTSLEGATKSFSGTTTSQAVFDGTYDGSLGSQIALTFVVTKSGVLGQDDTEVEVFDEFGTPIDRLQIDKETPDEVFTLSMGLNVHFTAGAMVAGDTFELDLSTSKGVVDPNQAFQGSGLPGSALSFQTGFELGSTVTATLRGQYDGAFDDTLRFEVSREGVVGVDDVEIKVFDGKGEEIDKLQFRKELAPGTELSLSNGLTLALSEGELLKPDQFELAVRADDQLVFSGGFEVQPGTLSINGTVFAVDELDTIQTLADEITASAAGVKATFDVASGQFQLTRKEDGPEAISLGPDSTGFFAAIGLEEGDQVLGSLAANYGVTRLSELAGLSSGTFTINGEEVSVDVENDTIDDVLARINSLEADITATYLSNHLVLSSSAPFELDNGTSGFFDAVKVKAGTYQPTQGVRKEEGIESPGRLKHALEGLERSLETVFSLRSSDPGLPDFAGLLETAIRASFDRADENEKDLDTELGLRFQLLDSPRVLSIESGVLHLALARRSEELRDFLSGPPGGERDGLIDSLTTAVDQVFDQLVLQLDPIRDDSLLLDIRA